MTPYTRQQIARKPLNLQQKCRKMNRLITEYRVHVEHSDNVIIFEGCLICWKIQLYQCICCLNDRYVMMQTV
jgi:hypothetical protein